MEVVMALAVVGTMGAGCYVGFNSLNTYAISSRLYSEAQICAQNQIDLILSKEPFNSTITPKKVPIELMTVAELAALSPQPLSTPPPTSNQYYPYYRNSNGLLAKQGFIYTDPVTANPVVIGTMIATVTDLGTTMTFAGSTTDLNTRRATVTVTYTYRGTTYNVSMDTMRTADQ
jgi:hypothetical protein